MSPLNNILLMNQKTQHKYCRQNDSQTNDSFKPILKQFLLVNQRHTAKTAKTKFLH